LINPARNSVHHCRRERARRGNGAPFILIGSHEPHRFETSMTFLADDYVVMDRSSEQLAYLDQCFDHCHVGLRRCRIAGWMVVNKNEGRGAKF
jgi:hypothetical protein